MWFVLAFAFGTPAGLVAWYASVYHESIAFAALLLLAAWLFFLYYFEHRAAGWLVAAGLAAGFAITTRVSYVLHGAALLAGLCALHHLLRLPLRARLRQAVALGLPLLACVLLIGAYNYARFGSPLEYGTTYCWRVDSTNDGGTTAGAVWCFDTEERPVPKVTNPMPADQATDVDTLEDLSWSTALGATSYVVYFGTNPSPGDAERRGEQPDNTFDVSLEYGTTYYWRVDSKSSGGERTGDVWSFTTVAR